MSLTKLQIILAGAVIVAGAGVYAVQEKHNAALRDELTAVPKSNGDIVGLRETNRQMAMAVSEAAALRVDDAELARLREEATAVQDQLQTNARAAAKVPAVARPVSVSGQIYDVDQLDVKPKLVLPVQPTFPHEMAQAGISGEVVVEFLIDAAGKIADARAVSSSRSEFEASAIAAVKRWKFDPGRKGGQMVNTKATQLIEYRLEDAPQEEGF